MRRRATEGRGIGRLVADFGHELPQLDPVVAPPRQRDAFTFSAGRRGLRAVGSGWTATPAPLPVYEMTSDQVGGVWPLISGSGLPPGGAPIGVDLLSGGGAFTADPIGWTLNEVAGVTNPNVMVFGAPGTGKSSLIKCFCLRMADFGYRTLILGDVKDEYESLCHAFGVQPHAVGHGLAARINPLDFGPIGNDWSHLGRAEAQRRAAMVFARWLVLIKGLVTSQQVEFTATAETAVSEAIRFITGYAAGADRMAEITLPQLWAALDAPEDRLVQACRYVNRQHFLDDTRAVRDALGTLIKGHLEGLFDAPTTIKVDWGAPIQSLSLRRLEALGDEAIGIALTCLNSWGRAMTQVGESGDRRIMVRDEVWKQMRLGIGAVRSFDADLRLSRTDGCIQIAVMHKPSDALSVGAAGSAEVAIARDLVHMCSTRVLFGQDEQIGNDLRELLDLTEMEQALVTGWASTGKGRSVWQVGRHVAKVQSVRTSLELAITDTNSAINRAE